MHEQTAVAVTIPPDSDTTTEKIAVGAGGTRRVSSPSGPLTSSRCRDRNCSRAATRGCCMMSDSSEGKECRSKISSDASN